MRKTLAALGVIFLAGCSTTSGTGPNVSHSGFDNAKIVSIDPHAGACRVVVCTGLGAQWNAKRPAEVILIVHIFNDLQAITGAKLNIDGEIHTLKIKETFTEFSRPGSILKESSKGFLVPIELVRKITNSQRTWLRVHTNSGSFEDAVIDGQTDSKAFNALKRFLAEVDKKQ